MKFLNSFHSVYLNEIPPNKPLTSYIHHTDEQDGKEETKVIYEGQAFDLPITSARAMLHQIESYARDCFDQTNEHIAAVNALDNIEDVLAYDFTEGYEPNPEF